MIVYKTELLKSLSLDDMVKRINKIIVQFENSSTYKKKRHYFMNNGGKNTFIIPTQQ